MSRVGLIGIAVAFALAGCGGGEARLPKDAELIGTYHAHRADFAAAVAEMSRDPMILSVELKGSGAKASKGADPQRVAKIAELLRRVGARSVGAGETGPEDAPKIAVRFAFVEPARFGSKAIKGVVYDPAASPQDQAPDTDAFRRLGEKAKYVYVERRIEGDWHIYQWAD